MTSSVLSLFILVNIASLLASPIKNGDSIFSMGIQKIHHRRSVNDNRVENSKDDGSEIRCSDFFSTTCNRKSLGIVNHSDLRQSIHEQIALFMKPLNFLLNDYDGNNRKGFGSLKIEQQLYHSCMNLGEIAVSEIPKSINEKGDEFNENQNNEDEDDSQYVNNEDIDEDAKNQVDQEEEDISIDASLEKEVKQLTEEIKALLRSDKNLDTEDSDELKQMLEVAEDEIEPEIKIKTATEIIKDKFNDIFSVFDKSIRSRFNNDLSWQELDQYLDHYGFARTFFNIRVAANPINPKENIVVLESPSIDDWNSKKLNDVMLSIFIDIQKQIYKSCDFKTVHKEKEIQKEPEDSEAAFIESNESEKNQNDNEDDEEEMPEVCQLLKEVTEQELEESIVLQLNREVINLYNSVLKYMFDPVDVTITESPYTLAPLNRLNSVLGYTNAKAETKIDWTQIVANKFKQLNVSLADDEIILIRNQPYFKNLKDVLSELDDELIVHGIRSKFIAENIRYHDWNKAYSLNPVEKSSFCTKQTKLYGISNLMLYQFEEEYTKPDALEAERILHNLIDTFHHNITKTEDIPTIQKVQFKSELKAITRHIFRDLNKAFISNIYGDFKLTGNYFVDIINYNSMLKIKNLQTLKLPSLAYENVPFSINEMDNPRNRFILHAISDLAAVRKLIPQTSSEKEIFYATYGVNMASFLYSLLREEKFGFVDMSDQDDMEWLLPRITYPPETIKCFITENIVGYGYNLAYSTITDIYGVRFAHAALLKDPESNLESSEKFIKAYAETQCNARNKRKVKKVLSQIQELPALISCKASDNNVCDKPAFRL